MLQEHAEPHVQDPNDHLHQHTHLTSDIQSIEYW